MSKSSDGPLILGLDIGSTNIKAVVYSRNGRAVSVASVPQETHYPNVAWAYFDPDRLWELCCQVIREAVGRVDHVERIASVAVTSFGEAGVLIDAAGRPTSNMIAWFDRRSDEQCQRFNAAIDPDRLFYLTGTIVQTIMTAPKLMWHQEHEPEAWARSVTFLKAADYIAWKLSGEAAQSLSLASRTGLLDLRGRDWSDELLGIANVERSFLPVMQDGGTPLGPVQQSAQECTGLTDRTLVSVGGHDHVCGALASGAVHHGDFLDSMGTSECLFVALDAPLDIPEMGHRGFTLGAHARDSYYTYGGLYTSGVCFDWIRAAAAEGESHEELLARAAAVPPGSLGVTFLPHLRLANTPHPDGKARGAFIGLTTDITNAELTRAVLEGVALEGRDTMEYLLDYAGVPALTEAKITGGTARNELLLRIKASVMRTRLRVLETEEAGALGAAMLGGIASGVYASVTDAVASIETDDHVIECDPDIAEIYDRMYTGVFRDLFHALQPFNHKLVCAVHRHGDGPVSEPLLVGLDVGTTNIKAVVVDRTGQTRAIASVAQVIEYPRPGWAQHDPERIWNLCCEVLRSAIAQLPDPSQIVGIAVASMGEAGVTLDATGRTDVRRHSLV